jgi:polysaccharide export outer membrane protein
MVVLFGSSCSTKTIAYLQDIDSGTVQKMQSTSNIALQPNDKLSIVVNSKDPELADLFNLPIVTHRVGYTTTSSLNTSQQVMTYTVDSDGNIDFPVVGKLHIAGMNREQVAAYVKDQLVSKDYVKDAVVTVEYANLGYSVLGEVSKPGRFNIDKDRITILDAISAAGDLTIYGKRENILVQREENGERKFYRVNLNSGENLYSSPVYYLQQNDIIYVEPNTMRARQSNVNGNNVLSASFWVSLASLATTITALIVK